MIKKNEWLQKKKHAEELLESKGISKDKLYLNRNALKKEDEDEKPNKSFGWTIYSEDAYYNAYDKRCQALQKNE